MKICILGSSGLLGTALTCQCEKSGIDFVGLDHNDFEIENFESLRIKLDEIKPDAIINTVAIVAIDPCEKEPLSAYEVNTLPAYYLAKYCELKEITMVQISTHAVFDGEKTEAYVESDKVNPTNIYSATKLMAEHLVKNNCTKHYIVRVPTMFGNRRNNKPGFTHKIFNWFGTRSILRIADDKIDSPSFSDDIAGGILVILEQKMEYGLYHIANSGKTSLYDFVVKMAELSGKKIEIHRAKDSEFPALAHKPLRTAMKSEKLKPLRNWDEALEDYIKSLKV